ncbi:hypothetical protein ACFQH6_19700 [Halobacteriaceae archaeon GCM10025711]
MDEPEPIVKLVRCPYDGCSETGNAVVPPNVELVRATAEMDGVDVDFDGLVYGQCSDHQFYVYYRNSADDHGTAEE